MRRPMTSATASLNDVTTKHVEAEVQGTRRSCKHTTVFYKRVFFEKSLGRMKFVDRLCMRVQAVH